MCQYEMIFKSLHITSHVFVVWGKCKLLQKLFQMQYKIISFIIARIIIEKYGPSDIKSLVGSK